MQMDVNENSLHEKARRAAMWFNLGDWLTIDGVGLGRWALYFNQGGKWTTLGSDRIMIDFAERYGWQDNLVEACWASAG